ncbi:unnamed protein product [Closterium sp. NIES-54]
MHSDYVFPFLQFTRRAGQSLRHRLHQLAAAMEAHRANNAQLCTDFSTGAAAQPAGSAAAVAAVGAAAVAAVRISTFHSFCLQTLRQFAHLAGLPKDFTVFPPKMQVSAESIPPLSAPTPCCLLCRPTSVFSNAFPLSLAETLMELLQEWAERKAAEAGEHGASRISVPTGKKLHYIIRRFLHEFGRLEAENAAMQVLQGSRPLHQPAAAAAAAATVAQASDPSASSASAAAAATNHGNSHRRRRISFGDGGGGGGEGDEDEGLFAWLWEQYRRRLVLNKAVDFSQFAP